MSRPGWKRVPFVVIPRGCFAVIGPDEFVHYTRPENDRAKWQAEVDEANSHGMGDGYRIEPREPASDR